MKISGMWQTSAKPPERESAGGKTHGLSLDTDGVTSYPDHSRIFPGRSKERSLRVPPQLGQVISGQGSISVWGKTTWKS
jgi:hypothetical protein